MIIKNLIGKHYIILSRLLILFTLLLLAFLSEPSYFVASSVQPDCFIASIVPYCGSHLICSLGSQIGTEQLWTPIILLNSPYGGSAVGSSSTSTQSSIRIVSGDPDYGGALIETSATDSVTSQISESNGSAGGVFELDTWTFYQAVTVRVGGDGQDNPCTQPYVARITATNPTSIHTMGLLPSGSTTDVNEPNSISYNGYSSVTFNNGWDSSRGRDGYITTCNQAYVYQVQTTIAITESVTLSLGQNVVSGSLSETTSSTNAYQYDFPSNGYWNVQLLNPSNHYSALAFYYVGPNGC